MSSLETFLSRSSQFTPDEHKLAIELEKIIFRINHSVHPGECLKGALFSDIKKALLSGKQYSDDFILSTLLKLEKIEFGTEIIRAIVKIKDKYYSNL